LRNKCVCNVVSRVEVFEQKFLCVRSGDIGTRTRGVEVNAEENKSAAYHRLC
jgi:hypothetical protein